jgi:hypothetical protein
MYYGISLTRKITGHKEENRPVKNACRTRQSSNTEIIQDRSLPKRTRNSSDSSILEVYNGSQISGLREKQKLATTYEPNLRKPQHKKKRVSLSSSKASSRSILTCSPPRVFEKRSRHKTREEHYEPKTGRGAKKSGNTKRRSRKGESRIERTQKVTKRVGMNLMENFSSKNIGHARLTVSTYRNGIGNID